jgi:hypothetical protein
MDTVFELDGSTLTVAALVALGGSEYNSVGFKPTLTLSPEAWYRVEQGRAIIDGCLKEGRVA